MEGAVKFNVSADTSQFDGSMNRVKNSAASAASGVSSAFKGVAAAIGGTMMLSGLKSLMNDFDRIGKLATRFDTSAESIQRIGVAAEIAGSDIEAVANAMTKAGIAASQASTTGGQMAEKFKLAGVNAREFANADIDKRLLMIAEAYAAAGGNADKTNAIIELMGSRAGANLIPLISNVEALREEMAGASVASTEAVRQIQEANDFLTRTTNDAKVAAAGALQWFGEILQGWTSLISGTGYKTIAELKAMSGQAQESAKEAADAIDPLVAAMNAAQEETRKATAVLGDDFARKLKPTAEQIAIVEEKIKDLYAAFTGDRETDKGISKDILSLEKERLGLMEKLTAEGEKQAEQSQKEAEQRAKSIQSAERELQILMAENEGDEARASRLQERFDYQDLVESNVPPEVAANLAAERARARQQKSQVINEAAPTIDSRVAEMRAGAAGGRARARADELMGLGMFRSADRAAARAEKAEERQRTKGEVRGALRESGFGNVGEAFQEFRRQRGMDANERLRETMNALRDESGARVSPYDKTRSEQSNFETALKNEELRKQLLGRQESPEEAAKKPKTHQDPMGGGGKDGQGAGPATEATLQQILRKIQERPILVA